MKQKREESFSVWLGNKKSAALKHEINSHLFLLSISRSGSKLIAKYRRVHTTMQHSQPLKWTSPSSSRSKTAPPSTRCSTSLNYSIKIRIVTRHICRNERAQAAASPQRAATQAWVSTMIRIFHRPRQQRAAVSAARRAISAPQQPRPAHRQQNHRKLQRRHRNRCRRSLAKSRHCHHLLSKHRRRTKRRSSGEKMAMWRCKRPNLSSLVNK